MKTNIREYGENDPVEIEVSDEQKRFIIRAYNEGDCNCTEVDC